MAEIVFAFGSSHGPTIATTPPEWDRIVERDKKDPRYNFDELIKNAPASMAEEVTMERKYERFDRAQVGIERLAGMVDGAGADVAVLRLEDGRFDGLFALISSVFSLRSSVSVRVQSVFGSGTT